MVAGRPAVVVAHPSGKIRRRAQFPRQDRHPDMEVVAAMVAQFPGIQSGPLDPAGVDLHGAEIVTAVAVGLGQAGTAPFGVENRQDQGFR